MFREERAVSRFAWKDLGDIALGRPNLGPLTSVAVYRLMQYTMRDVLITRFGVDQADHILFEAGKVAGNEFCRNVLDTHLDFGSFVAQLKQKLIDLSIGILNIEKADMGKMEITMTVAEDLDCSGLPVSNESVCTYDEGFLAGILKAYMGKEFDVREIDCWATGERICRFRALLKG